MNMGQLRPTRRRRAGFWPVAERASNMAQESGDAMPRKLDELKHARKQMQAAELKAQIRVAKTGRFLLQVVGSFSPVVGCFLGGNFASKSDGIFGMAGFGWMFGLLGLVFGLGVLWWGRKCNESAKAMEAELAELLST